MTQFLIVLTLAFAALVIGLIVKARKDHKKEEERRKRQESRIPVEPPTVRYTKSVSFNATGTTSGRLQTEKPNVPNVQRDESPAPIPLDANDLTAALLHHHVTQAASFSHSPDPSPSHDYSSSSSSDYSSSSSSSSYDSGGGGYGGGDSGGGGSSGDY